MEAEKSQENLFDTTGTDSECLARRFDGEFAFPVICSEGSHAK